MNRQFTGFPGDKMENPNEQILSCWEIALVIARSKMRIEELKKDRPESVTLKFEEEAQAKRLQDALPKTLALVPEAQKYEEGFGIRDRQLSEVSLGVIKEELEYKAGNDADLLSEIEDEDETGPPDLAYLDIGGLLDKLLDQLIEVKKTGQYISTAETLLAIYREIFFEVRAFDFTTLPNTPERTQELALLKDLGYAHRVLAQLPDDPYADGELAEKNYVKRLIDSTDQTPMDITYALRFSIRKVLEELQSKKFTPLPKEPIEVATARKNLRRGRNAIN